MTRRLLSMAGIVVAGTVLLTGCGALGAASESPAGPAVGQPLPDIGQPDIGQPESAPQPGFGGSEGGDTGGQPGVDVPQQDADGEEVIVQGSVAMQVADPIEMADAVADAAAARDGSIDRRSEGASTDFQPAWAMLTVRVPTVDVEGFLDALRGLADLSSVDVSEQRVGAQVRDLEVRVNAARASVDRLTELLATAADTETLLEVEAQLTERTSELEQLLSQQRSLADQVAMSTIEVQIRSTTVDGPTGTPTFWDGLIAGWNAFLAWGATFLFGLGQSIPALVVLAVLALVVWLIVRRIMQRMPSPTTPPQGAVVVNPVTTPTPAAATQSTE
ncbi:DUF4349 domain-containing protein [Agrococcus beijingensis]|uniref:DUF4349 domain-containing protein n=1 Tax=Agrococcus beijingensis TaxID=3068634 RepID=UPI002740F918|nr:DUF4349 domain-containing protein [Agrococcus sp. REN33]